VDYAEADARPQQRDVRRLQDFLTVHGWVLNGLDDLSPTGGPLTLHFRVPRCIGIVGVSLLPPVGETASLLTGVAGADYRVFYVHQGRTSLNPPRFAYLRAKVTELVAAVGIRPHTSSPVLAVSQPQRCRLEAALPWSEL
jgi:hypothetical protein